MSGSEDLAANATADIPRAGAALARARRRRLRGRSDELARLHRWVRTPEMLVAFLHGPGGVGKSALLDAFGYDVERDGWSVVRIDGADVEPTPAGFLAALGGPVAADTVLLLDRFEALAGLASWLWREWLPGLPTPAHVLIAGRHPPPAAWRADPAFAACGLVLAGRNLDRRSAADLIADHGVDDAEDAALLASASRGHPLAIVVAADVHRQAGPASPLRAGNLLGHPDVTAVLVERFLDDVATVRQRRALHVCGHARRVDRALLRAVLDLDDAGADELLQWLRTRPYTESHPDGLSVHDLVKDVLDRDLRWRDREAFLELHAAIRRVVVDRMTRADDREHDRLAGDLFHLHRHNPAAAALYAFADLGGVVARPLRTDPEELDWLGRACAIEGRATAAARWATAQPAAWTVFEDGQGRRTGAGMVVRLDRAGPDDLEHDPVARWALDRLAQRRPPEPDEVVLLQMAVAADDPHHPGVVADQTAALSLRAWRTRRLGWAVLATALEPVWAPMWHYIGFERLGSCPRPDAAPVQGKEPGGQPGEVAVWARDFARGPFDAWLDAMTRQELDEAGTARPPVATPVALSREDFDDAVIGLLKDLARPGRLRANPLAGSGLVPPDADPSAVLPGLIGRAVDELRRTRDTELAGRALDRTYLRPAGSQERAAEVVGTSFSTYRRHLARGTRLVQERLWEWEVHGPPGRG